MGYNTNQATKSLQENKPLQLRRLQLKGRTKWFDTIPNLRPHLHPQHTYGEPGHCEYQHTDEQAPVAEQGAPGPGSSALPSPGASIAACQPQSSSSHEANTSSSSTACTPSSSQSNHHQADNKGTPGARQAGDPQPSRPNEQPTQAVFFSCPRCPRVLPAHHRSFSHSTLDTKVWCNDCRRSLPAGQWQCSCHVQWHVCPFHQHEPTRLRQQQPAPPQPKTKAKQKPQPKVLGKGRDGRIQQWLDQPAPKRARSQPEEIELGALAVQHTGLKRNLLGPKLQAKFQRLWHHSYTPSEAQPSQEPEPGVERAVAPPVPHYGHDLSKPQHSDKHSREPSQSDP